MFNRADGRHFLLCGAKVFATLNELPIEAVRTCSERITDEVIEAWKLAFEKEAGFAWAFHARLERCADLT